jgi:hypothetical protein
MKLITGTKDRRRKKKDYIRQGEAVTQIRCTKCHELAVKTPDGKGGFTCKCPACKTEFRFSTM